MLNVLDSRYKIQSKLGEGGFGSIWKALECQTNKQVALKLERIKPHHDHLKSEVKIYQLLHDLNVEGGDYVYQNNDDNVGIPRIFE